MWWCCAGAGAGAVVPALLSSWLWLLLVFTVVVLATNGAGAVVVLVVFIVKWLLLRCANCGLCKKEPGSDLIDFGRWSVIKNLMTIKGHNMSSKWEAIRSENKKKLTTTKYMFDLIIILNPGYIKKN